MLTNNYWFNAPAAEDFYPHEISHSIRYDGTPTMSRTQVAGNRKQMTFSTWLKRSELEASGNQVLFMSWRNSSNRLYAHFSSAHKLVIYGKDGAVVNFNFTSAQVFRDTSAWYHLVIAIDTTLATQADRLKVWINGKTVSWAGTIDYPAQNETFEFGNAGSSMWLGNYSNYGVYTGLFAETIYLDGTVKSATDFAEEKEGAWIPKEYTGGGFGNNGFHLDYADSAALGNDVSGENHDFTPSGFHTHSQTLDSPTNNFAILNQRYRSNHQISDGGLTGKATSTHYDISPATFVLPKSGKWYWELRMDGDGSRTGGGVTEQPDITNTGVETDISIYPDLGDWHSSPTTRKWALNDLASQLWDADTRTLTTKVNNGTAYTRTISGDSDLLPFLYLRSSPAQVTTNFGQDATFGGRETPSTTYSDANGYGNFYYDPPSGALALCSQNLPYDSASPANLAGGNKPTDHFQVIEYTGDGASSRTITGFDFQPDFVWIKRTDAEVSHILADVVNGATKNRHSDYYTLDTEYTSIAGGGISAFASNGFTVANGSTDNSNVNASGAKYTARAWKAGGTAVSNTDGTITSQVSANTDAGFSIVGYTGNATSGATVGHGLTKAPEMIIFKNTLDRNWDTYHHSVGATRFSRLDQHSYWPTDTTKLNSTSPTNSVITLGYHSSTNENGATIVAYCWHSVPGYSQFGTSYGHSNDDGYLHNLGFRPAFIMFKGIDSTLSRWVMYDIARDPVNPAIGHIWADLPNAETVSAGNYDIDIYANGFKITKNNTSTVTHINSQSTDYVFMAFAENPFKYANAR